MTDDVVDLLVVASVVRHITFLQFHLGAKSTELLDEPNGAIGMCLAVRHTRAKGHLALDIGVGGIGVKSRSIYGDRLFITRYQGYHASQKEKQTFSHRSLISLTEV